jgi:hypothetical protein
VVGRPAVSDDGRFVAFVSTFADLDANAADARRQRRRRRVQSATRPPA